MDSELTPSNVTETLTIAPETTAAPESPTDAIFDDEAPSLGLDDAPEEDESEASAATPADTGEDATAAEDAERAELETLRQLKAQVEAWNQQQQAAEEARRAAENARYWQSRDEQAIAAYRHEESQIYAQAPYEYDAAAFIASRMQDLNSRFMGWQLQERNFRENVLATAYTQALVPEYVGQVADAFGIGAAGREELLRMYRSGEIADPDQIPREASRLAEIVRLRREVDQSKRSQAAQRMSASAVTPGSGHATGSRNRNGGVIEAGSAQSRDLLLRLLSQ